MFVSIGPVGLGTRELEGLLSGPTGLHWTRRGTRMRIFITGGSGTLGRRLVVDRLRRGQ